jgi:hypothetical protein
MLVGCFARSGMIGALALLGLAGVAKCDPVSLANDFSVSNGNPNGQWVYQDNTTNLSLEIPLNNGNPVYPAMSGGYWGTGNNLNVNYPDLFKAQVNGSSAGETNGDFLAGDIVGLAPNDGSTLFERWTAPSSGTITDVTLLVWYAHSLVTRSDDYELLDNSLLLTSGTVSYTSFSYRNSPASYDNVAGFSVQAGDVISLGLTKSAGQAYGALAGESLDFTFMPSSVPEPSAGLLLAAVAVGAVVRLRRRFS